MAVDRALEEVVALGQEIRSETPPVSAPPPSLARRSLIKLVTVEPGDAGGGRGVVSMRFQIDRTEVRVDEYRACVRAGQCTPPGTRQGCNWDASGRGGVYRGTVVVVLALQRPRQLVHLRLAHARGARGE